MRLFDTPGADAAYDRWLDPPEPKCPEECNCEDCHDHHMRNGEVAELAELGDFQCCEDQLDSWIDDGEWCGDKPKDHGNAYMWKGRCLECLYEQRTLSSPLPLRWFWVCFYKASSIISWLRFHVARKCRR